MQQRLCAISVDLDEIPHYHAIHGLPPAGRASAHAVYERAIERCAAFARELDLPLTWFVVANDLAHGGNARLVRELVDSGHEIANHSLSHAYDLVRLSPARQREEVALAAELIEREVGVRPLGFRAPGYSVSDALLKIVASSGHSYDSSVFPSAPYYAAKAMALLALRVRRRHSGAILESPALLRAPRRPYRIGSPYTVPGTGLVELPVQVTRGLGLPYIGTALVLAGKLGARALTELVIGEPFINLELHGIDWLGAEDGLDELRGSQPDVRLSLARKRALFTRVVERIRAAGYRFVRLSDVASNVSLLSSS